MSTRKRKSTQLFKKAIATAAIVTGAGLLGYAYYKNKKVGVPNQNPPVPSTPKTPSAPQALPVPSTPQALPVPSAPQALPVPSAPQALPVPSAPQEAVKSPKEAHSDISEVVKVIDKVDNILSRRKEGSLSQAKTVDDFKRLAIDLSMDNKSKTLSRQQLNKLSGNKVLYVDKPVTSSANNELHRMPILYYGDGDKVAAGKRWSIPINKHEADNNHKERYRRKIKNRCETLWEKEELSEKDQQELLEELTQEIFSALVETEYTKRSIIDKLYRPYGKVIESIEDERIANLKCSKT
jgi:hypothetical protein